MWPGVYIFHFGKYWVAKIWVKIWGVIGRKKRMKKEEIFTVHTSGEKYDFWKRRGAKISIILCVCGGLSQQISHFVWLLYRCFMWNINNIPVIYLALWPKKKSLLLLQNNLKLRFNIQILQRILFLACLERLVIPTINTRLELSFLS